MHTHRPLHPFAAIAVMGLATALLLIPSTPWPRSAATPDGPAPSANATPAAGWWAAVQADLREAEYEFSRLETGGFSAPNRAQDLRTRIGLQGVGLGPRRGETPAWNLNMRFSRIGRGDSERATVRPVAPIARGNRVEIRHAEHGVTEWYVNEARGLEQGFTIDRPPGGRRNAGPVVLELALGDEWRATVADAGREVTFAGHDQRPVLRSSALMVLDARGRDLPARFVLAPAGLEIRIDDRDARYPLIVDPLLTTFAWSAEGIQDDDEFGAAVSTAGDVNGDGFSDILVGAPNLDAGSSNEGRVYLYLGSDTGPELTAAWTAEADRGGARMGTSVATAGDVNGDGFDDIIIGAPYYDSGGTSGEGGAFVWLGSANGLGANGTPGNADWRAESNSLEAHLGMCVATAGDVNGDGYDDVIVGAPEYESGVAEHEEGYALVWLGGAADLGADGTPSNADWHAESNNINSHFATCVATAGDVNGDGYVDVVVGSPY